MKQWDVTSILDRAKMLKITIALVDGDIQLEAAKGVITPKVLEVIQDHLPALIDYFTAKEKEKDVDYEALWLADCEKESQILYCSVCADMATCEVDGNMYCAAHYPGRQEVYCSVCADMATCEVDGRLYCEDHGRQAELQRRAVTTPLDHPVVAAIAQMFGPLRQAEVMSTEGAAEYRARWAQEHNAQPVPPGWYDKPTKNCQYCHKNLWRWSTVDVPTGEWICGECFSPPAKGEVLVIDPRAPRKKKVSANHPQSA